MTRRSEKNRPQTGPWLRFLGVALAMVLVAGCASHGASTGDIADRDKMAREMASAMGLPLDWQPSSQEEAEAVAAALGLKESCGDRCWNCSNAGCGGKQDCPFFSCTANCASGHHPVCCYGCAGQPPPSSACDPPKKRDYKALAEKIAAIAAAGDPDGVLTSCSKRCDGTACKHCHGDPAHGIPNECPANRCCDPIDCLDNCLEKQHPVCCAGC